MGEDCVFRYPLGGERSERVHRDRLAEMVRQQLCNILDIAQPLCGEAEVTADGFRFHCSGRRLYALHGGSGAAVNTNGGREETRETERDDLAYQDLANAAFYEPRIEFIARQLAGLLSVIELESGGEPVQVDGFRLRDLKDWVGPHAATPADIFNHAATHCQYDCVFCYNRGIQGPLRQSRAPRGELAQLQKRLDLYEPSSGRGLFPTFTSPREVLAHPAVLPLLRELRAKTDAPFRLCTNGGALDREFVKALAELAPVYLDLSLNSSSPQRRSELMGDEHPQTAIAAPALLAEASIPFSVTVVAWPHPDLDGMLKDLEATARYAEAMQARVVQVNLPGYSRFFSTRRLFDTGLVWSETVQAVQRLRGELSCPIVTSPSLYEENLARPLKNQAEIIGVVKNSPADRWGLAAGDVVTAVNGTAVRSRPPARDLLSLLQASGDRHAALTVRREGRLVDIAGDTEDWGYPYDAATGTHLGAVFMGAGLRTGYLERIEVMARESGAREILFLTSGLVRPTLEQMLRERPLTVPRGTTLSLGVPQNRYFGGNIVLGDLLVVQDFIDFLREYTEGAGAEPDLVIIPSSPFHLSGWKRDLTGRPYQDIERETGLPVRLLECHPIWD